MNTIVITAKAITSPNCWSITSAVKATAMGASTYPIMKSMLHSPRGVDIHD